MKKLTKEEFIKKAIKIHGSKYDYSNSVYINTTTPLEIFCKECNKVFIKKPNKHTTSKQGCPRCSSKKHTKESFIERSKKIHGDNYDYSHVVYINNKTKVKIKCKECNNIFEKTPANHIIGKQGCPSCSYKKMAKSNTLEHKTIINRFISIHGNKYDYSNTVYTSAHEKITVICKKHGEFKIYPYNHDRGDICPECYKEGRVCDIESFIDKSKSKFNYYDYSKFEYTGVFGESVLTCKKHNNSFKITPNNHLNSKFGGCEICNKESRTISISEFKQRCGKVHGFKYNYNLIDQDYTGINRKKIKIICNIHGIFNQSAIDHYNGCGCQKCAPSKSKYEDFIENYLIKNNIQYIKNDRSILETHELDFVVDKYKIAIEINGLRYHTEISGGKGRKYHLNKSKECEAKGYRLIHINEDEILHKQRIVISKLNSIFKINKKRLHGRKCIVKEISKEVKSKFLDKYHLQGDTQNTYVNVGLFYNDKLTSIMCFGAPRNQSKNNVERNKQYELTRYCGNFNFSVMGGASKMLKYFENTYNPKNITTFSDNRWSDGSLYFNIGFKLVGKLEPDYRITTGRYPFVTLHKSGFKKSQLKTKLIQFDENKSEWENLIANGWDRIWDCGKLKFSKDYSQ